MRARRNKVLIADRYGDILIAFERLLENDGYDATTAAGAATVGSVSEHRPLQKRLLQIVQGCFLFLCVL